MIQRPTTRRPALRAWAALLVVAVLAGCSSDPEPEPGGATTTTPSLTPDSEFLVTTVPTPTEPPPVTLTGDPFVDRLYGRVTDRWILTFSSAAPDLSGVAPLPWFELTGPGEVDGTPYELGMEGYDGCNWFGMTADVDDDGRLGSVRVESTAVACEPPGVGFTVDGVRLTFLDEDELEFTLADGSKLVFGPLDAAGDVVTDASGDAAALLDGDWSVATYPAVRLTLLDGRVFLDGCLGAWTITDGRLTVAWEAEPTTCLTLHSVSDVGPGALSVSHAADRLIETLAGGSAVARLRTDPRTDQGVLTIADEQFAFSLRSVGGPSSPTTVELGSASVFGVHPGDEVDVDSTVARIASTLGTEPTLDTGWYPVPDEAPEDGSEDCIGGPDYRVVWWGDLRLAFWRHPEGSNTPALWNWSVGDRDVMWFGKSEPDPQPDAAPSMLPSGLGFSVGDPLSSLGDRLGEWFLQGTGDDGIERYMYIGRPDSATGAGATLGARDGVIVGYGAQLMFC